MQIIEGDDVTFRAMTFGLPNQETFDYFRELGREFGNRVSETVKAKVDEIAGLYKVITLNDALNSMKAVVNNFDNFKLPEVFMELSTLSELQNAPQVMIPFIMANPTVHEMYHRNMVEGYSGLLKGLGENPEDENPLYQSVTNGITLEDENGEFWTKFYSDVRCGDLPQLSFDEKLAIMKTWESLDYFISLKDCDPTSRYNSKL